jgi:surface carbohydrate biosynthesis protein
MMLRGDIPAVLFPVETLTRELDSKLVMASALATEGCRAIVGHKESVEAIATVSTAVIWQGKGELFDTQFGIHWNHHTADHLIGNRSAIMFLQDEGGLHQVKAWRSHVLNTHRIDYLRTRKIDRICVWGERQQDVLSSYAEELRDNIVVTGSPRFDLCLPEYAWLTARRSDALREKYGSFILVCTRFRDAVHAAGQGDPFQSKMNPTSWSQSLSHNDLADLWFSKWQRDVHDFADFVVLIKQLAINFSKYTVVLRPHPSESLTFYQQAFSSFKNVVVTRDDSALPWVRAAKLVIHSNCTTGIEAVLLGRPVLNLLPECEGRAELNVEVAREAGHVTGSISDAVQKADDLLSGDAPPACEWSSHAKAILNNLKCAAIPKVAAETMGVIQRQGITSSKVHLPKEAKVRDAVRRIVKGAGSSYAASKRGPLDAEHVARIIDGYLERHGRGGRIRHMTEKYVVVDPA